MYCKGYWLIISPKERNDSPDLCLEDSGSYLLWLWIKSHWLHTKRADYWNPCAGDHLGPWFMESFPFFCWQSMARHAIGKWFGPYWKYPVHHGPRQHGEHCHDPATSCFNILGERQHDRNIIFLCLTSKVKYFFKFLMIITSGRAVQATKRTRQTTRLYWWVSSPLET